MTTAWPTVFEQRMAECHMKGHEWQTWPRPVSYPTGNVYLTTCRNCGISNEATKRSIREAHAALYPTHDTATLG